MSWRPLTTARVLNDFGPMVAVEYPIRSAAGLSRGQRVRHDHWGRLALQGALDSLTRQLVLSDCYGFGSSVEVTFRVSQVHPGTPYALTARPGDTRCFSIQDVASDETFSEFLPGLEVVAA